MAFILRDLRVSQNRTSEPKHSRNTKHGAPVELDGTESPGSCNSYSTFRSARPEHAPVRSASVASRVLVPAIEDVLNLRRLSRMLGRTYRSPYVKSSSPHVHPCSGLTFHVKTRSRHTSLIILELRLFSSSSTFQSGGFSRFLVPSCILIGS